MTAIWSFAKSSIGVCVTVLTYFVADYYNSSKHSIILSGTGDTTYFKVYRVGDQEDSINFKPIWETTINAGLLNSLEKTDEIDEAFKENLRNCLETAKKNYIPDEEWKNTPLVFRGIDELWLKPAVELDKFFYEMTWEFNSHSLYTEKDSIGYLDNNDEVLYNWIYYSVLRKGTIKMTDTSEQPKVSLIYLTNTALQIAYKPSKDDVIYIDDSKHIKKLVGSNEEVYFRSYLGGGLYSARKDILTYNNGLFENELDEVAVTSDCIKSITAAEWKYHGITYKVSKPQNPVKSHEECENIISKYIESLKLTKVSNLTGRVITQSFIANIAKKHYIVAEDVNSFTLKYLQIFRKTVCQSSAPGFDCLDLTYIEKLLTEGLGLPLHTVFQVEEHEADWTTYYAVNLAFKRGLSVNPTQPYI